MWGANQGSTWGGGRGGETQPRASTPARPPRGPQSSELVTHGAHGKCHPLCGRPSLLLKDAKWQAGGRVKAGRGPRGGAPCRTRAVQPRRTGAGRGAGPGTSLASWEVTNSHSRTQLLQGPQAAGGAGDREEISLRPGPWPARGVDGPRGRAQPPPGPSCSLSISHRRQDPGHCQASRTLRGEARDAHAHTRVCTGV